MGAYVVDEDTRSEAATWTVDSQSDIVFETVADFMMDERSFVQVLPGTSSRISMYVRQLFDNLDETIWGQTAGHTYCKSISYQTLHADYARAQNGSEPWMNNDQ